MATNPLAGIWDRLPNQQTSAKPRGSPSWSPASLSSPAAHDGEARREHPPQTYNGSPRSSVSSNFSAASPLTPAASSPARPLHLTLATGAAPPSFEANSPAAPSPKSLYPDSTVFSGLAFLAGRQKDFGVANFGPVPVTPATTGPPGFASPSAAQPSQISPSTDRDSPPDSARESNQHALAEIFAGNPRPHYRSASSHSGSVVHSAVSPRADAPPEPSRSYFSAPAQPPVARGRSLSSAPALDHNPFSERSAPTPINGSMSQRSSSQHPDQYGYRPVTNSSFSSSLPASSGPIRINTNPGFSSKPEFSPSSYTGGAESSSWRRTGDSVQRHSSFSAGGGNWEEREGRARVRDGTDAKAWGDRHASIASSAGTGIGVSNMSPFTRDGGLVLAEAPDTQSSAYRSRRDYSLGAVGSGRKRGDAMWGSSRALREDDDEDNEDAVAPTRSGATSRRHSFAAPPSRSQIGFSVPNETGRSDFSSSVGNKAGRTLTSRGTAGYGSSAIDDDDLAADLNSLHLNLEAHAAATSASSDYERSRAFAPVGSLPSQYPQSRPFDTTAQNSPTTTMSPPKTDPFGASGLAASRLFQPAPVTSPSRNASKFEFGSVGATTAPGGDYKQGNPSLFRSPSFPQQQEQQQQQADNRYMPSFHLPPSPPNSFYSSLAPPPLPMHAPSFQNNYSGPATFSQKQPFYASSPTGTQQQQQQQPVQQQGGGADLTNLGRGIPLHSVPADAPLYIVEFKAGRKDLFFVEDPNLQLRQGDLVIVEADRGKDIGKFYKPCSLDEVQAFQQRLVEVALGQLANPQGGAPPNPAAIARMTKEFAPKKIFGKAQASDTQLLLSKAQDEVKALTLIRNKVAQKNLAMEVCDAEWQWDRRKLTFYFTLLPGHTRVDFRELVRELFRIYKTRLWLCSLDQSAAAWNFG